MQSTAVASERGALSVVWDVIVAPKAAFEALAQKPRWLVAFAITCVLGIIGAFLQIPVQEHASVATLSHEVATNPQLASLTPDQIEAQKKLVANIGRFTWVFSPVLTLIAILFAALVLVIGNAIARGSGTFAQYFAVAAHVALINWGINFLLIGVISTTHAPETMNSGADIARLMPSLAWLAPADASAKLVAFLAGFNIAAIWTFALCTIALTAVGKLKGAAPYIIAAIFTFGGLVFVVPLAK